MPRIRLFLLGALLLLFYIILDFPGVKIAVYMTIVVILWNKFYIKIIEKNTALVRKSDTFKIFTGIPEKNLLCFSNSTFVPIHAFRITDIGNIDITSVQSMEFLFTAASRGDDIMAYEVIGRKRGRYFIGPTTAQFSDIIGLYSYRMAVDTKREIIVFPNVHETVNISYKSMQPSGPIKNYVPIYEDPSIITGMREYVPGDEIKKINWKVSARQGKYFVNTFQPSISVGTMLFLNLYDPDYDFHEKSYHQELGIETAASLFRHFYLKKQEIGFLSNCRLNEEDQVLYHKTEKGEFAYSSILTSLALIEPNKSIPLDQLLDNEKLNASGVLIEWGTNIYVLSPELTGEAVARLLELKRKGHIITVINISPEIKKSFNLWNVGFQCYFADLRDGILSFYTI